MESLSSTNFDEQSASMATDLIWKQALRHFAFTNNELLLPMNIGALIGPINIERLKSQLATFLGRSCVVFVDNAMGCIRILPRPEFQGIGPAADHMLVPQTSIEGEIMLENYSINSSGGDERKTDKKPKVPRPPNAFILYRKHQHAILKGEHPEMHNNEISVTVGNQWNNETAEIKSYYKALAEEAKRQHAQKYPNYQYAPRKPCEKKRRNSRRTILQLESDTFSEDDEENSLQTPCESPINSSSSTLFITDDSTDVTQMTQTLDDVMALVKTPSQPADNYGFSDFGLDEYNSWVDNANDAQRFSSVAQTNAHNGTYASIF